MSLGIESDEDRAMIRTVYRSLMRACMDTTTKAERKEIRRAFEYARDAHIGAKRKSGEPYIVHPVAVAHIVAKELSLDSTSIICALLHDVVEDTFAEIEDIRMEFGSEVARIIDGLTKISGVFDHKSSAQAENFRKMLLTLSDDIRVILIKLADRLHNMRTLQFMKKEGQLKIASETLYLYAPLANRLGLHSFKTELENLALKYTEPSVYLELNSKLQKAQRDFRIYIRNFMQSIRDKLKATGLQFEIKSRFKSIYSIYSKMLRQEIPFEEVFDLFAIRIIVDSPAEFEKTDCWRIYSLITDMYKPNPERMRDWITIPKSNGYEALHVTVMGPRGRWIEVQIRTRRMDEVAEKGYAAHWRYKDDGTIYEANFEKWLKEVRELLENPSLNAVEVVREFKTNLVTEEVFVFTPKGDLFKMAHGSTVLDFAYEIHTSIGDNCIGAKVNNKVVPVASILHSGDQVEIITSKKQQPKEEWLTFVRTAKARHKIKEAVKREKKAIAEKGREMFLWKAKKYNIDESHDYIHELLHFFKVSSQQEFYYLLGMHRIDTKKIQEFIQLKASGGKVDISQEQHYRKRIQDRDEFEAMLREKKGMDSDMLMIGHDMNINDYKFAPCCQPVPGDDILGFFNPDEGLVIHRTNCKNAIQLMSNWGKNIIKSKWTELSDITFLAGIRIMGEDRQGMMNALIKVISNQMKLNIRSITIDSNEGMFEGVFKVFVLNTKQINDLKEKLAKVPGVFTVTRVESDAVE